MLGSPGLCFWASGSALPWDQRCGRLEPHIGRARRGRTSRGFLRGRWWQRRSRSGTACPPEVLLCPDASALSQERGGVTLRVDLAAVVMDSWSPVAEPLSAAGWCRVGIPWTPWDAVAPWGGGPGKVGEQSPGGRYRSRGTRGKGPRGVGSDGSQGCEAGSVCTIQGVVLSSCLGLCCSVLTPLTLEQHGLGTPTECIRNPHTT